MTKLLLVCGKLGTIGELKAAYERQTSNGGARGSIQAEGREKKGAEEYFVKRAASEACHLSTTNCRHGTAA